MSENPGEGWFKQDELDNHRRLLWEKDLELSRNREELEDMRQVRQELLERNEDLEILASGLRTSEALYRERAESIADPFFALDADLRYTFWNEACELLTGIAASEALGKSIHEIFPDDPENRERAIAFYKRVIQRNKPETFINAFHIGDGLHHFQVSAYPYRDGATVFVRDIIDSRKIMEDLRESNRELDAFALVVSHDLKSSMVFIEDFARRALGACLQKDLERVRKEIGHAIKAVRGTREYIEQLHEYARAGYREKDDCASDAADMIQTVIEELKNEAQIAGAELIVAHDLPRVAVNALKLRQVFHNLICNSLDHAFGEGLRIEVGVEVVKDRAKFFVRDNGRGIPPEEQTDIFLPFKRMQGVETAGMGLGLSIAKRAVESWGGKIWVESSPQEGCCFIFTAPLDILS
jgi:PAS domain S-box-containing protein